MDDGTEVVNAALSPTRAVAFIRRVGGPIWGRVGLTAVLEVPGRRTGVVHHVTLSPIEVDGSWYVLTFGGVTEWARNLRAAARGKLRRKGRTQAFTAIEVDGDERDRVIAAYLARLGPISRDRDPIKRDFDRRPAAADHPTFRIEQIG
jgi:deazaflavin-dependent oxidoreductase (nitroreductase family)